VNKNLQRRFNDPLLGPPLVQLSSTTNAGFTEKTCRVCQYAVALSPAAFSKTSGVGTELGDDIENVPPFPPLLRQSSQTRTRTRWRAHRPIRPCRVRPQSCSPQSRRCPQRWTPRLQNQATGFTTRRTLGQCFRIGTSWTRGKNTPPNVLYNSASILSERSTACQSWLSMQVRSGSQPTSPENVQDEVTVW
jgi:hypothetical protein